MDITARAARGSGGTGTGAGAFEVNRADTGLLGASVAPGLLESKVEVFVLEGVELLKRVDLLEPLADCLELLATSFLAILWAAALCKGAR